MTGDNEQFNRDIDLMLAVNTKYQNLLAELEKAQFDAAETENYYIGIADNLKQRLDDALVELKMLGPARTLQAERDAARAERDDATLALKKMTAWKDTLQVGRDEARRERDEALRERDEPRAAFETPLKTSERNTLLVIIAALCSTHKDIDHQAHGAAPLIAKMTENNGAAVTDDTIRKVLRKIPDAMEARKK